MNQAWSELTPSNENRHIETLVATSRPGVYINRLCRHFAHKVNAKWDTESGYIIFSIGRCLLNTDLKGLQIRCEAPDDQQLQELMGVIKSHFDRFAVKEDQLQLQWPSQGVGKADASTSE